MNPWAITIFAALVVIAGGWFLGQALARVFNGPRETEKVAQAPTPLPVVTPVPSPSPAATVVASPTPMRSATPKPKPTPEPSPTATPQPTAAPTSTPAPTIAPTTAPTAVPTLAPTVAPTVAAAAATEKPAATAPASTSGGPAARVVREYIDALRRGDPGAASNFLGNGVPDESFIDSATRITSVTSTSNGDGSYKVEVDMHTAKGEYYETFTVASDRILDKTAIKP